MKPLFLVGFMGSGKSTVGKIVAQKLGIAFYDLDLLIEKEQEKTISEIFKTLGEANFRKIERNILRKIANSTDCIVSTGGGTPCFFDNMAIMNNNGVTIYLNTSIDELTNRLCINTNKRPLLQGKTKEELRDYITQTLTQREKFYKQAHTNLLANDTKFAINFILNHLDTIVRSI